MCFAPQRRALFRHLNSQKPSEAGVFAACTFSTSQLPKVGRRWDVLYILTSKCASRHNGVQFFISHLASWLRTRRFSEPTFRPSGASNHWKNTVFRDFATFARTWIFFLLTLSLSSSLLFSDSSHLCFSSVHIVGSLTSKLPSATVTTSKTITTSTTLRLRLRLPPQLQHYNFNNLNNIKATTTTTTTITTTTTTALHHTTSTSCEWGDRCNHCNHSKKHNSNHLSVHQWLCSAIRDSQQPASPIGLLFLKLPPPLCAVLLIMIENRFK